MKNTGDPLAATSIAAGQCVYTELAPTRFKSLFRD